MNTKYRVWMIPQIPGEPFTVEVPDRATGDLLVNALANYDLFQYKNDIKPDYSNAGGVQIWDVGEGDWVDIDEDDDE